MTPPPRAPRTHSTSTEGLADGDADGLEEGLALGCKLGPADGDADECAALRSELALAEHALRTARADRDAYARHCAARDALLQLGQKRGHALPDSCRAERRNGALVVGVRVASMAFVAPARSFMTARPCGLVRF